MGWPGTELGVLESDAGVAICSAAGSLVRAAPQSADQSLWKLPGRSTRS
jgi:hypothetical protein